MKNHPFVMLLRRELWEHRSLWIAPLVWVAVLVVMFTWGTIQITFNEDMQALTLVDPAEDLSHLGEGERDGVREALEYDPDRKQSVYAFSYMAIGSLIAVFMCVVVFFYLIDCLFTERRDRSILFWKSLPVSDTQVVLSKFAMAMVVVPIGVLLLSAVTQLLLLGIWNVRFQGSLIGMMSPDWDIGSWLRAQVLGAGITLGAVLWYAPIAAYFLLLSVWVKRLVFLWAVIPLLAAPLLERMFLGTKHIALFVADRFGGFVNKLNLDSDGMRHANDLPRVQDLYDAIQISGVFTSLETWVGLAAAAGLLFATIRIRRFRDDS